ncbi:golgin-45 [Callorhinchus milii]|uniref:Basic leucine zipper nuclear factor 1 n=1 Tax=Callorhinchus milii TaxID=7868 RepID=A0A4W3HRJ6_CALMI|nr:golgin-45 [Callorhinchus milii]|eukprot:gi/632948757/ref/XP_007889777.1/ PREDICTED: golgin-45 [Callorhinchus milii]
MKTENYNFNSFFGKIAPFVKMEDKVQTVHPVRRPGDGMETEKNAKSMEKTKGINNKSHYSPQIHVVSNSSQIVTKPGVLQLGKIQAGQAVEVEAIRILVPKAAIIHDVPAKSTTDFAASHKGEALSHLESTNDLKRELTELKASFEKLQNSERKLLQDKEGLANQIRVQTEVNRELKKLLIASVGNDLQYQFERMAREKNQLILENETLSRNLAQLSEQFERMTIQCDVWRSKFLASRVMADELTNARTSLQRHNREAQSAIHDLLSEREQFRQEMVASHGLLEKLLVSLQWGRQQTYYPNAQANTTAELASANHKLAEAVNSHLLGKVDSTNARQMNQAVEFSNTPAEKMAEKVLKMLDPTTFSTGTVDLSFCETSPTSFLSNKKSIGRFHPYTRYENITFNCCNQCNGELIVL